MRIFVDLINSKVTQRQCLLLLARLDEHVPAAERAELQAADVELAARETSLLLRFWLAQRDAFLSASEMGIEAIARNRHDLRSQLASLRTTGETAAWMKQVVGMIQPSNVALPDEIEPFSVS
jgi:hypothetical protein